MNTRLLAVVLIALWVLVTAAFIAAPAGAHTVPTDDAARVTYFMPLATAAWPDSPCAGHVNIVTGADADATINALDAADGKQSQGRAVPATCTAYIRSGLDPTGFCVTLVHESGHLAGMGHTHVLDDVMNGDGQADYPPCHALADPTERQAVVANIQTMLPAPVATWRIACTSFKLRRATCRATRPGAKFVRRYLVQREGPARTVVGVFPLNPIY